MTSAPTPGSPQVVRGPAQARLKSRYRRVLWVSVGLSAIVHALAIVLYPTLFQRLPTGVLPYGGGLPAAVPRGTELVTLRELPAESETEPPPREEPEPEEEVSAPTPVAGAPGAAAGDSLAGEEPAPTAAERIRPRAGDLRFWAPINPERTRPSEEEVLRLRLMAELEKLADSTATAEERARRATDWTYTDAEGRKWGVTPGQLHLGGITLPLPFSFGVPPGQRERVGDRLWEWDQIQRGASTGELLRSWRERDEAIRRRMEAQRRKPDTTGVSGGRHQGSSLD